MTDSILHWNLIALDAARTDFSFSDTRPPEPGPQQPGPTFTSRALAIVHLAMYDAYMGVRDSSKTYLDYASASAGTTAPVAAQAAVAAAACLTLIALYSRQRDSLLAAHNSFIAALPGGDPEVSKGLAWGHLVAQSMLADRSADGSDASDTAYAPSAEPFRHRADPLTPTQGYLGPQWGQVRSFGFENLRNSITALADPTTLAEYEADYLEVLAKGARNGSTRSNEETTIGIFWAYDGARNIGTPPRLYNQIVRDIVAAKGGVGEMQNARLFAMVNVAMADAGIQAWHEKYRHNLWRPVIGIREASAGWGPTGKGDGKSGTIGDPYWEPLGAPRTNSSGPAAFTPNFPAYPSGHATFGTTALRVAQAELQLPGSFAFESVSDEFNGRSVGATGVRPLHRRRLTIDRAIEENILSRVYLGVHWQFDGRKGAEIGQEIADKLVPAFPQKA
jgi:Vanadium chloroperoxidase N-terminal domain